MQIYAVIHHRDPATTLNQATVARDCGANGVFLISHRGEDDLLVPLAGQVKHHHRDFRVGINLLSRPPMTACEAALLQGLDMVWADQMGVSSAGGTHTAEMLARVAMNHPQLDLFASVAFKYQAPEPDPAQAAVQAKRFGFIPTTSGVGTGHAPDVAKIADMSRATAGRLAVASGMTPENVHAYAPYLSHILVATGVSLDEYRIDPSRLSALIANSRR